MKSFIKLLLFLLGCIFAFGLYADEGKPLVLVMGEDSYPYQFVDEKGEPHGILIDLWKVWSQQTDTEVVFVSRHWHDSLKQLSQGDADAHVGLAQTSVRSEIFDFAQQISQVRTYLYLHKDLSDKSSFTDLIPYQIGIVSGSSHEAELLAVEPKLSFKRYNSRHSLLKGVIEGEIHVFAGMEGYLKDNNLNRQVVNLFPIRNRLLIKESPLHPAVIKSDLHTVNKINLGFAAISSKRIAAIEERWLGINQQKRGITVATSLNIEPFVSLGGDGLPHGLYVDVWHLWSDKTGIPVFFSAGDMNSSLDEVRMGSADVHIGYPESDVLKSGLLRSQLLYKVKSRLFSFGHSIDSLDALAGTLIGAVPTAPYLGKLKQAVPDAQLKLYDSVESMIQAAREGHISGFVASSAWTQHYLVLNNAWSEFHQFDDLEFETDIFVLTRPENLGLDKRIKAGFELIDQNELAEIEQKWMLNSKNRVFDVENTRLKFSESQQDYLASVDVLKVGYLTNWKPMEYADSNGEFSGINSEVVKVISDKLNLKLESIVYDEWQDLITALLNGEVDIAGSVAETEERKKKLLFSEPYWPSPWALATQIDRVSVFHVQQLTGQRLAIVEGYQLVTDLMSADYGLELLVVADTRAGLKAVSEGKADAFVEKVINMAAELKQGDYGQLKMSVLADFSEQHSHFGIHPNKAKLVPMINMAIGTINQEKQQEIYQNWVKQLPLTTKQPLAETWWFFICFLILASIVFLLLFKYKMGQEVSKRLVLEDKLNHLANHDSLTQLPNRSLLDDRLEQAVLHHSRDLSTFAVLFVNIGCLKEVNKKLGHKIGDNLLISITQELKQSVRKSDTVARFGADEFVIILNRTKDLDIVCQVADTVLTNLAKNPLEEIPVEDIKPSIGIAIYPADGDTAVELLKTADKLMYRAKKSGGNCYKSS
ncbi:transporter substrate-binding domain-containing protein [Shewanella atlantica]|uniref:Transporter substrate-binding domain-containing protein n=1 Tax=Shewanella atlantica TaxID=271099 RepID=A0A3S0IEG9_9GAMM|nr:transporter substrate-binding domain-containing protein [Shewanella atlantica]RTR33706.1 transporter substrate-binding domain-containing protein [Shewanella atlantica]